MALQCRGNGLFQRHGLRGLSECWTNPGPEKPDCAQEQREMNPHHASPKKKLRETPRSYLVV